MFVTSKEIAVAVRRGGWLLLVLMLLFPGKARDPA
jgi:hypothetical protein